MSVATMEKESQRELVTDEEALELVREVIPKPTPLYDTHEQLGHGNRLWVKDETETAIGAFKLRGAWVRMNQLSHEERQYGVVTASAGNHGQGVAFAAQRLGVHSHILVPRGTADCKKEGILRLGGDFVTLQEVGESVEEGLFLAQEMQLSTGRTLVHPYDDEAVIAGQGTIGRELDEQLGDERAVVFVPVGGGGLIAGFSQAIKQRGNNVTVVGVQLEGADSAAQSFGQFDRVRVQNLNKLSDGTAVPVVGRLTHRLINKYVDGMITISNGELGRAYWDETNRAQALMAIAGYPAMDSLPEPAGLLAEAGAAVYAREHPEVMNQTFIAIRSGKNVNMDNVEKLLEAHHDQQIDIAARRLGPLATHAMVPR